MRLQIQTRSREILDSLIVHPQSQVSGWRGETRNLSDMENRIYANLSYQRDWSLNLDIKILIKTFLRLRSGNAY